MAISRKLIRVYGPHFYVYLPIEARTIARNRQRAAVTAITLLSFSFLDEGLPTRAIRKTPSANKQSYLTRDRGLFGWRLSRVDAWFSLVLP
jgi:hypothetical protein